MKFVNSIQSDTDLFYTLAKKPGRYANDRLEEAEEIAFADTGNIKRVEERLEALTRRTGAKGAGLFVSTDCDIAVTQVGKVDHGTFSELDELLLFSDQPIKRREQYIHPLKISGYVAGYILVQISAEERSDFVMEVITIYADFICHELELAKKKTTLEDFSSQLEAKKQQLEKVQTYNENLLSITSHDLSSPLNAVSGYLDLMNECLKEGTKYDQIESYHQRIQSGVQDVMDMLKQLSNISKIEEDMTSLDMVKINVVWLVKDICELVESNAIENNIKLTTDIPEAPAYAKADTIKLKRVIYNLVTNAIKYTDGEGTVAVRVRTTRNEVRVDVADNGVGIPASQYSKIFAPFVKLNHSSGDDYSSCGLGLYVASHFMDLMNGSINIESEEGVGSTFTLALPQEKSQGLESNQN